MLRTAALLTLLLASPVFAKPPRLMLLLVVDSVSSDLLLRTRPQFKAGMRTLLEQGAYYPYMRYEYAEPLTASGHTTLATGTYPWRHGIVANRTFNRQTGKAERPFADPAHPPLEAPLSADDVSPENILVETLADRLRESTQGRAKVVAISEKARSAIPLAGRLGQAYWYSEQVGKFVTGTYYAKEFPAWLRTFDDRKLPESYFGKDWNLLLAARTYVGEDDRPFEGGVFGMGRTFPHPLSGGLSAPGPQFSTTFATSPFIGEVLVQLAKAVLEGEAMGKDDVPDLLAVSFSQTDRILHQYGPFSWEIQDTLMRLDRSIQELLSAAEKAAGRGNVMVVLTADHGGDAIPEELAAEGMPAGRVNVTQLRGALSKELASRFKGGDLVWAIESEAVYLNAKALTEKAVDPVQVRKVAAAFLRTQPGIAYAVSRDDILSGADVGPYTRALRLGFHPDRSADVFILPRPHVALTDEPAGSAHFSPYAYDQLAPLVLYGRGIHRGVYRGEVNAVDVAPTASALLEIGFPASVEGEVRTEALESNGR
jgi:hypothetical protein